MIAIVALLVVAFATPWGRATLNTWFGRVQKADDATRYATQKKVEDTARAMVASYCVDTLYYEQFCDSPKETEQEWAQAARMRANKTAMIYNQYILENSFIWADNIPSDIDTELQVIR